MKEGVETERKTCVETVAKHLIKNKNGFKDRKGTIDVLNALLNKNASRRTNKLRSCPQIKMRNKTVGLESNTGFCCENGHDIPLSPNLTHPDNKGTNFMHYDANVKAFIQGYMNKAAGNSLDTTNVLLDLPSACNLNRSFSCKGDGARS